MNNSIIASKIIKIAKNILSDMSWEECISDVKKNPEIDNPEAFCGWLKYHGPNAPKSKREKPFDRMRKAFKLDPPKWLDKSQHGLWQECVDKYQKKNYGIMIAIFKNYLKKRGMQMKKNASVIDSRDCRIRLTSSEFNSSYHDNVDIYQATGIDGSVVLAIKVDDNVAKLDKKKAQNLVNKIKSIIPNLD